MELENREKLYKCIDSMADAMDFSRLPIDLKDALIEYVLFGGDDGKNSYECFEMGLITEREYRNLFMAHCATNISRFNGLSEPSCTLYNTRRLSQEFEIALMGKIVIPKPVDVFDPWENSESRQDIEI